MVKGKRVREKGKIRLSEYFKKIVSGSRVAVVTDMGVKRTFPERIKGKSGRVLGDKGDFKIVELKDGNKTKIYNIHPIHLRKL